ncbi:glutathione S-transferase [Parvularcula sp. LCG005]|uniref:glutathione S-transferase family protein n=1 Tax=Parvularcula sp. LCG005 TaxID=3078805 RepID=UPI00294338E0|nr:glutathione S-transferase [Parvularcula sp. LCG005]WOI54239.1 glutathione S-transferase [Parvularcula sp. LCG005]
MIIVHHLENSRSQRILWLLEELGVPYEVRAYARNAETMLGPDGLEKLHPLGKWPVIEHEGRVLAESGAIVEYLIDRVGPGRLAPPGGDANLDYLYWLHFAEATMQPNLVMMLVLSEMPKRAPALVRPVLKAACDKAMAMLTEPRLKRQMTVINERLKTHRWFAGEDISGADIMMSFALETGLSRSPDMVAKYPHVADWVRRIQAREAYRDALKKGGEYKYLLAPAR